MSSIRKHYNIMLKTQFSLLWVFNWRNNLKNWPWICDKNNKILIIKWIIYKK